MMLSKSILPSPVSLCSLALLLLCGTGSANAQPLTQQQGEDILKELRGIRQALELLVQRLPPAQPQQPAAAPARPPDARVTLAGLSGHELGRPDAPVTMVEFTDLQCPFCRRFATTTFAEIKAKYIDTGQVRYIARDLPIPQLHPQAHRAAVAARCAGEQSESKYWEMRELLLKATTPLTDEAFASAASQLKLDARRLEACLASGKFDAAINNDVAAASAVGISGTPSFVIGRATSDKLEGLRLVGAQPFAAFEGAFKQFLGDGGTKKPKTSGTAAR